MLTYMRTKLAKVVEKWLTKNMEGAALVEYALLVTLIALVCVAAITAAGTQISSTFDTIVTKLSS